MNKKLLELLNQINAQKQVVIDLANAGKLAEAKAEKEKLQQMQDKFDLLKDVEDPDPGRRRRRRKRRRRSGKQRST